jgi:hypothetical protein
VVAGVGSTPEPQQRRNVFAAFTCKGTPFEKFGARTRVVMSVPKAELDRREEKDRKAREERKKR